MLSSWLALSALAEPPCPATTIKYQDLALSLTSINLRITQGNCHTYLLSPGKISLSLLPQLISSTLPNYTIP